MQTEENLSQRDRILGWVQLVLEEIRMVSPIRVPDARILSWCSDRLERRFLRPFPFKRKQTALSHGQTGNTVIEWSAGETSR